MKICFVRLDDGISGGARVIARVASLLRQRGHSVALATATARPKSLKGKIRSLISDGFRWRTTGDDGHFSDRELERYVVNPWREVNADEFPNADIVVATWWETADWVRKLPATKGARFYLMMDYPGGGMPIEAVQKTWEFGLHIITISRYLRDLVLASSPQQVDVLRLAVDLDQFETPPREKRERMKVGFVYTKNPAKGSDVCRAAVDRARMSIEDLECVSLGRHEPGDRLPEGTVYHFKASEGDLPSIYSSCDAWLFGSHREGFGLPILEAMASRTPIIASRAGAAPELVTESVGELLTETESVAMAHEMANSIVRIARMSPEQWHRMSDAAYERARQWTWDDAVEQFESFLEES